jgi:hypothetical protein
VSFQDARPKVYNLAIQNEFWDPRLEDLLFGPLEGMEAVTHLQPGAPIDLYDLLVSLGLFRSRGECRKNWGREGGPGFPPGFHSWRVGKLKFWLTVWNPVPEV